MVSSIWLLECFAMSRTGCWSNPPAHPTPFRSRRSAISPNATEQRFILVSTETYQYRPLSPPYPADDGERSDPWAPFIVGYLRALRSVGQMHTNSSQNECNSESGEGCLQPGGVDLPTSGWSCLEYI